MLSKNRFRLAYFATFLLLFLCLMPAMTLENEKLPLVPHIDKFVHFMMFSCTSAAWLYALETENIEKRKGYKGLIMLFGVIVGWATEWMQSLPVIYRDTDFFDFSADMVGVIVAIKFSEFYIKKLNKLFSKKKKNETPL